MKYAGIIYNDFSAAPGVCLTFFVQGCDKRCKKCHNRETWDFNKGREFTHETLNNIIKGLQANGIKRKLCIMGGEPLHPQNLFLTNLVISTVKEQLPNTEIFLWTGYMYEDLEKDGLTGTILKTIDVLIDGPYIEAERDITLKMRGSANQRVINLRESSI